MCGMNLAFDRQAIGPAMYFGLMGEGQPWGRYDGARARHAWPAGRRRRLRVLAAVGAATGGRGHALP